MRSNVRAIIGFYFILGFIACDGGSSNVTALPSGSDAIFVVCEGNYGANNSALSVLDTEQTDTSYADVFGPANGKHLGDYAHNIVFVDSTGYIPVMNSN